MDDIEKFKKLKEETDILSNKKIRLEERFKNEKKRLEDLISEITEKGYDPKKLSEIKEQKETELKELLKTLEIQLKEISEKLNLIEV